MQAVRNKMATLKAKLDEANKAADDAENELSQTNEKADETETRVGHYIFKKIIILPLQINYSLMFTSYKPMVNIFKNCWCFVYNFLIMFFFS